MLILISTFMIGCAARDVRPGADGVHTVSILTDEVQEATRYALRQAKRYCKKEKKNYAILNESSKYSCEMPEAEYIRKKQIAKAAQMAGSAAYVASEEDSTQELLGSVVSTGAAIADEALGDCYEVRVTFSCQ